MSGTDATSTVVAMACVPNDVISNILERVDLVSLFRCSLVCKEWRGLVSDRAFLRRLGNWPEPEGGGQSRSTASLLGIFVQRDRPRKTSNLFPTTAPVFVPAPGSVLGPQVRFLTSFVRDDDGILHDATPLAARDGLLLVRVWRPHSTPDNENSGGGGVLTRLCVCNLLAGKLDILPALDVGEAFDAEGVRGYAVLTSADSHCPHDGSCPADGYTTLFQVLLVGRRHALQLLRFSSASGDWDALDCSQPNLGRLSGPDDGCHVATVARGKAHWLLYHGGSITLEVSAGTGQVSAMTAFPVDAVAAMNRAARSYKPRWLCTTAEGSLALLCMETNNRLVMMKQRDDGGGHVTTDVHVDVDLGFGRESLYPVCIGDRSGTALAVSGTDPERRAYVLDIDLQSSAASATKVEGWFRNFNYTTAAPFEINWAIFFASRLGVRQ